MSGVRCNDRDMKVLKGLLDTEVNGLLRWALEETVVLVLHRKSSLLLQAK